MGGVGICPDMVSAISHSPSFSSCNNAVIKSSRFHSRRSLPLPRGLAEFSSQSSLYVRRSDRLELACRGGGARGVKLNGKLVRVVCAKGSDNGPPRPEYRYFSWQLLLFGVSVSFIFQGHGLCMFC